MKTFFYIYYRISKAYKFFDGEDYCMYGSAVLLLSLGCIALSLLAFLFSLLGLTLDLTLVWGVVLIIFVLSIIFTNKRKYLELEEQYKTEKYRRLKGWLVFLYIIASIALYFVSLNVFDV